MNGHFKWVTKRVTQKLKVPSNDSLFSLFIQLFKADSVKKMFENKKKSYTSRVSRMII